MSHIIKPSDLDDFTQDIVLASHVDGVYGHNKKLIFRFRIRSAINEPRISNHGSFYVLNKFNKIITCTDSLSLAIKTYNKLP